MTMSYRESISLDLKAKVEKVENLSYLSWANAYGLAGRPEYATPMFDGSPFRKMLGGAVVAIDLPSLGAAAPQRVWLPLMDYKNKQIPEAKVTGRDVTDALGRCLTKAIAMHRGVGLSAYAGYDGDGAKVANLLGPISPGDTDLSTAGAVTEIKGEGKYQVAYVPWWASVAASMLADPTGFHWNVAEFPVKGGAENETMPFLSMDSGVLVAVDLTFAGRSHRQWLPVMDNRNGSKGSIDTADWNKTVMRCLAKGIAMISGYGLSVYAGEDTTPVAKPAPKPAIPDIREYMGYDLTDIPTAAEAKTVRAILDRISAGAELSAVKSYIDTSGDTFCERSKAVVLAAIEVKEAPLEV